VDWVLVELRNAATPATLVRTQAALLQSDGDIVGLDNNSTLTLPVPAGTYHVAIRHRNHLGVMTGTAVALSSSPTSLDLTTGLVGTYGTNALKTVGAYRVLRTGNSFRNTNIKYTGSQNDRDPILIRVGSITPNNTANGYFQEDVNLNGQVKYTGSANDRDPILLNVGSIAPNNTVTEQLP
ncbi:MAG TPA: hemagglutinin protein, partial [Flavobacteriales bacterium]|nr:hemagglutinin protein [Flavobacteriales bacterium]